jgi:polygalacturonase
MSGFLFIPLSKRLWNAIRGLVILIFLCNPGLAFGLDKTLLRLDSDPLGNALLIQKAIDTCSLTGGGKVRLPVGIHTISSIALKTGVRLVLPEGCVLLGDTQAASFPFIESNIRWHQGKEGHHQRALIVAMNAQDIGIEGNGRIEGNGEKVFEAWKSGRLPFRWLVIWMQGCRNISIRNIYLYQSPSWMQLYQNCENLRISEIHVWNFGCRNNDGLDLDGCRKVWIENSVLESDDDALAIKTLGDIPCVQVEVRNCELASNCNAFKVGTETESRIAGLRVRNLRIRKAGVPSPIYNRQVGLSGLALTMVDGGILEDVDIRKIRISGVKVPFFIRQGRRNRRTKSGNQDQNSRIRNIRIADLKAEWVFDLACHITAADSGHIRDLDFSNLHLRYNPEDSVAMGWDREPLANLPEAYPEATMFRKSLPEVVWFCKGVAGIRIRKTRIHDLGRRRSGLPAFYCQDCAGVEADL